MNFNEIKEIVELIDKSSLAFFEINNNGCHLKLDKSLNRGLDTKSTCLESVETFNNTSENTKNEIKESKEEVVEVVKDENTKEVVSPMVGTFYSSASPESEDYVKVGDTIKVGDTLCIVEAMKLMNEIQSEVNGVITEVLVNSGDMVEYGQPLFKVKEM